METHNLEFLELHYCYNDNPEREYRELRPVKKYNLNDSSVLKKLKKRVAAKGLEKTLTFKPREVKLQISMLPSGDTDSKENITYVVQCRWAGYSWYDTHMSFSGHRYVSHQEALQDANKVLLRELKKKTKHGGVEYRVICRRKIELTEVLQTVDIKAETKYLDALTFDEPKPAIVNEF